MSSVDVAMVVVIFVCLQDIASTVIMSVGENILLAVRLSTFVLITMAVAQRPEKNSNDRILCCSSCGKPICGRRTTWRHPDRLKGCDCVPISNVPLVQQAIGPGTSGYPIIC